MSTQLTSKPSASRGRDGTRPRATTPQNRGRGERNHDHRTLRGDSQPGHEGIGAGNDQCSDGRPEVMMTAREKQCADEQGEDISATCCQTDVQAGDRHQVTRAGNGEALPLIIGHQVARTDRYGREDSCIRILGEQPLDTIDESLPDSIDRAGDVRCQQPVSVAGNDIAGGHDSAAEKPCLVVEYAGISVATGPAQA